MGKRSRKRSGAPGASGTVGQSGTREAGGDAGTGGGAGDTGADRMAAGYARGRAKDDAVRAQLEPLAPGERPTAVTVAAIVAVLLALANVAAYAAGARVGEGSNIGGLVIFVAIMLTAAIGMWRGRYWAVLGFEALLAITVMIAALSLAVASNVWAVVLCTVTIAGAGFLFYKLIRAMSRMQMPQRRPGADAR